MHMLIFFRPSFFTKKPEASLSTAAEYVYTLKRSAAVVAAMPNEV